MATNATILPKPQQGRVINGGVANGQADIPNVQERMKAILEMPAHKRTVIEPVRTGAKDLIEQLASQLNTAKDDALMDRAQSLSKDRKTTFSQLLEDFDPSYQYVGTELEGTDAFQRQLYFAGIRVTSDKSKGLYADTVERFFQSNTPASQVLFPEYINRVMRQNLIAPDILDQVIATTTAVNGDYYRTIYVNDTTAQRRMVRVGQGAEIPKTSYTPAERMINLYKYGRVMEGTYEFFRNVQIDMFAILLQRVAMQAMLDKADTAVDVAINGDGNGNSATNYNQSSLDTGSTPTYKAFLAFQLKFWPYQLNTLVGSDTALVSFLTMARPSIDPFQVLALLQPGKPFNSQEVDLPQNIYGGLNLLYLPSVPSGVLVGLDKRFALEQVVETGASIVETDRLITSQRNQIAITEKVGFGKIFDQASATWTVNA